MQTIDSIKPSFFPKEIKLTFRKFLIAALIYLVLPVIVFFFGYLKPVLAVLFSAVTIICTLFAVYDAAPKNGNDLKIAERSVTIRTSYFLFLIPFVLFIVYIGGVGEFSWCVGDHRVRYAILYDLIEYKWPVIYDFSTQKNPVVAASLGDGKAAFSYYFVFWMIPALFGKLFGLMCARIILLLWSAAGLILIALGANLLYGKQSKFLFVAIMMFAGFDLFPYLYQQLSGFGATWEDWTLHFRVVGNFYQIMNVFHQSIPGWLVTVLLLLCTNSRFIGLLGSLMFCYSPWAAIGILPLCIVKLFAANRGLSLKKVLRNVFTVDNIGAPVIFFICFASLYLANSNARYEYGFIWEFYSKWSDLIIDYLAYVFFEFGFWAIIIRKKFKNEPLFYASIATLMIIALYKMTRPNDLLMRGSMAPLFSISLFVAMYVTDNFNEMMQKNNKRVKPRLVVLSLFIAAYTTFNFLITSVLFTSMIYTKMEPEQDMTTGIVSFGDIRSEDYLEMVSTQFYVYDHENNLFFKYLAKRT